MKPFCFLLMFVTICCSSCQRSSGTKDNEDTSDTNTSSEATAPETSADSATADSNSSIDTEVDTETASESQSDTVSEDTGTDTTPLPDPVENEWIYIEGGSFEMGSEFFEYSQPVHTVTVPSFEILKTEVTVYQYSQCVLAGVCEEPHQSSGACMETATQDHNANNWFVPGRRNYPVNCVDYLQATKYCEWMEGRLASEAEWEYAARGGGRDIGYPWGDEEPTCEFAVMEYAELIGCGDGYSTTVCSRPRGNSFHGLCDMSGNCEEWVMDIVDYYLGYEGAPSDGSSWEQEDYGYAITRGGNALSGDESLHVTYRSFEKIDEESPKTKSIRCVRGL